MSSTVNNFDDDNDDCYNTFTNFDYLSNDEAKNCYCDKNANDVSLLHWNISSLPLHMNDLNNTLANLSAYPDIIALSETRITETVNKDYRPHLDNYRFIPSIPSKTRVGSVGVFVRNSLQISIREELCASEKGLYETLWFDVLSNSKRYKRFTIGVIYRHPGPDNIITFTNHFENVLKKLNETNSKYFICGDFNINTLLWDKCPNISSYIDTVYSHNTIQMVNVPTHFPYGKQKGKPSLLDHFYTNVTNHIEKIALLTSDVTDHLPIMATLRTNPRRQIQNSVEYVRCFRHVDSAAFNNSLSEFENICDPSWSTDQKYEKLQDHIKECVEIHAPLRKLS